MTNQELKHTVVVSLKNNFLSDYGRYKFDYRLAYDIAALFYDRYFNIDSSLHELIKKSDKIQESDIDQLVVELESGYREIYRDKIAHAVNAVINGFPIDNDNISIYGKSCCPTGVNSPIYETETPEIQKLRADFLEVMPI